MWKHMARIIGEVRPEYAFVENSPMLTVRGLGTVLGDLSEMGYDCRWGVVSAADIGANHRRERIWIVGKVANPKCIGLQESANISELESKGCSQFQIEQPRDSSHLANTHSVSGGSLEVRWSSVDGSEECGDLRGVLAFDSGNEQKETREILAYTSRIGQQGQGQHGQSVCSKESGDWKTNLLESIGKPEFWSVEPNVGRVADGVASRVDRLKAIGNGQVPLCAATAWRLLTKDLKV
jgi:DNA (cytosine-5)-methyltransferase 1